MALSPKTARTLNKQKNYNELCSKTESYGIFACVKGVITSKIKLAIKLIT